jgi:hypothetical protein
MSSARAPPTYKGKPLGLVVLVAFQLLVGLVHVFFGFWLLSAPMVVPFFGAETAMDIYSVYTIAFGLLTLAFTYALWMEKLWGFLGTVAVSLFVIAADVLALLDLPSVPGIPKVAGFGEIGYSALVLVYLGQTHVRIKFGIRR